MNLKHHRLLSFYFQKNNPAPTRPPPFYILLARGSCGRWVIFLKLKNFIVDAAKNARLYSCS